MADVLLSDAEKIFIIHGIQDDCRTDGRGCLDYRVIELETGVVSNCSGSAHVRLANTDVLVGVKAELDAPESSQPNRGRLEFFVDCTANADPEFEGRGGEDLALGISSALSQAFSSSNCLDLCSLCVLPGQQVWVLYVDILILEYGGSLLDAVSLAVKAALMNTKIPAVTVNITEEGSSEIEVSDDPYDVKNLDVSKVPCIVTLTRVSHKFVADATKEEQACSIGHLSVAITESGSLTAVRKTGSGSLHPESILDVLETAQEIGVNLNQQLIEKLKVESSVKKDRRGFLT
ncbi:exosome complex exonuclease RRP42-like [Tachypleus tridentatus]|uniref:exosome complex exonuclease RRP42-like n=1 Tax=Tachypleus tridentatus TaxID=6853 RepID=UPI003FD52344